MTGINQTRFFYLFEFRDTALHGVYMYGENTIAAICSVIGALWPPLWVPPKLARQDCRVCHQPTYQQPPGGPDMPTLAASCSSKPASASGVSLSVSFGGGKSCIFRLALLLLRPLESLPLGGHFGNSRQKRLRNHSTSDSQTLTQTRAASCFVSASTLQRKAISVRKVY